MNDVMGEHVGREELAAYLYGELEGERRAVVAGHVARCAACREELGRWEAVRGELQRWRLGERKRGAAGWAWVGRAIAAGLFIAVGFGVARVTAPRGMDGAGVRAQVAEAMAEQKGEREAFAGAVTQALAEVDLRRAADSAALRRDIETVAVRTQAAFRQMEVANGPVGP